MQNLATQVWYQLCVFALLYRVESHRSDPRDKVPTAVKETTPHLVKELPIMHIKTTPNNTIITLSDSEGKVIAWTSAVSGKEFLFAAPIHLVCSVVISDTGGCGV